MKELYVDPTSYKVRVKDENGNDIPLDECRDLKERLKDRIKTDYGEAWKACMADNRGDIETREEKALERFCRCNFGYLDGTADISEDHLELEEVQCPLRGYCKQENVICKPKLMLSGRQRDIMEGIMCGGTNEDIAVKKGFTLGRVKDLLYRIRKKFGVDSTISLTKFLRGSHQERRMKEFSFIRKKK